MYWDREPRIKIGSGLIFGTPRFFRKKYSDATFFLAGLPPGKFITVQTNYDACAYFLRLWILIRFNAIPEEYVKLLARPLFSSKALIPWKLFDLDEIWHTHSGGTWIKTCKVSTCYKPHQLRFWDWKQSRSSISWNLCFFGWTAFFLAGPFA